MLTVPHLQTVLNIPPDQLAIWPRSFWTGRTGLLDISHPEKLSVLITPHFIFPQVQDIHNIIYTLDAKQPPPPTHLAWTRTTTHISRNTTQPHHSHAGTTVQPHQTITPPRLGGHLTNTGLGQGTHRATPKTIQDIAPGYHNTSTQNVA